MNDWLKLEALTALTFMLWLPPTVARMPKLVQGLFLFGSLPFAIATIPISRRLILAQSVLNAEEAMEKRLIQKELSLSTAQQERNLEAQYGFSQNLHPEVIEEKRKSLEALLDDDSESETSELPTSRELALAVRKLVENGVSKTYIVEEVLGMKGRNFKGGMKLLDQMLQTEAEE